MKKLAVAFTLVLCACAEPAPAPSATLVGGTAPSTVTAPSDPLAQLAAFTLADLAAADADAVANNDALAHACYPALAQFVQSLQGAGGVLTVKGAFSVFQKKRDLVNKVGTGLPVYLKLGCAALVQDETLFLAKLAAIGGGSAVLEPGAPMLLPVP